MSVHEQARQPQTFAHQAGSWSPCACGRDVCPEVKARQGGKTTPAELYRPNLNPHLD